MITRRRGADTAHTQMGRPTRHIRGTYSRVHTQTHTNTNKHTTWPDKVRCGLTPWRRPPHQRRAPRPHPQQTASLSRSPTPKLCAPPPKGAEPAARATSTSTSSLVRIPQSPQLTLHTVLTKPLLIMNLIEHVIDPLHAVLKYNGTRDSAGCTSCGLRVRDPRRT